MIDATTDPNQIDKWWERWPDANIGVITGRSSGLAVVDADGEEGVNSVVSHVAPGDIDRALISQTGNGGYHLYFRCPNGEDVRNKIRILPGVDIRGNDGYVVAPPSRHYSGQLYTWVTPEFPERLAELPTVFRQNGHTPKERLEANHWSEQLQEGRRNNEIARRAGKLLANDLPVSVVCTTLLALNQELCDPPLDDEDIFTIVHSVARTAVENQKRKEKERQQQAAAEERSKQAAIFPVMTFAETVRKHGAYSLTWAIPDWLPDNTVGLVVAPPGSYKTWVLADLFTAIGGGRKFLGQFDVHSIGPVLMVQQEDFMPMLVNRVCQILGAGEPEYKNDHFSIPTYDEDLPLYFHDQRQLHIDDPESLDGFRRKVEEIRPKLVVLDPLYSAVGIKDYMSESAQKMLVLKTLRDDLGCSFMLAHHTVKTPGEGRQRDDAWGSQFLNAWLETGWQLRAQPDSQSAITLLRHFKVAPNPPPLDLEFSIDTYGYQVTVAESEEEPEKNTTEQLIMEMVARGNIKSMTQIRKELKLQGFGPISKVFSKYGVEQVGQFYRMPKIDVEIEE